MKWQFESLMSFLQMSGHGFYVWLAYGITFVIMLYLLLKPRRQYKQFIAQQQRRFELEEELKSNSEFKSNS